MKNDFVSLSSECESNLSAALEVEVVAIGVSVHCRTIFKRSLRESLCEKNDQSGVQTDYYLNWCTCYLLQQQLQ